MAKRANRERWPVLRCYDQGHLARIALPLGGIGTGTVSLGGRGDLRDWEVMNRPAKGFVPGGRFSAAPFFALYAKEAHIITGKLYFNINFFHSSIPPI